MPTVILNDTGGISGIIKVLGVGGALVTLFRPKFGIYVITLETCYLDYIKKLGTYYGVASPQTVIEILSMTMLTIGFLWVSVFAQVVMTRKPLNKAQWGLLIGVVAYSGLIVASGKITGIGAVRDVVNGAGILGVVMAITVFYKEPAKQMLKYTKHLLWILLPWVVIGYFQYYGDYTQLDYWYAKSNLSIATKPLELYQQWYGFNAPIGFASTPLGFGFVGFMYAIAFWYATTLKKGRCLYVLIFLLSLVIIFHTDGRTSMLSPMIGLLIYWLTKRKVTFLVTVSTGVIGGICLIVFAQYIVDNVREINQTVQNAFFFVEDKRRVSIGTLSARIQPFTALSKAENWSLLGIATKAEVSKAAYGDRFFSHNAVVSLFFTTGASGLLLLGATFLAMIKVFYKILFYPRHETLNKMVRFGLAFVLLTLGMRLFLGGNFATQPNNIVTAIPVGLLVCGCMRQVKSNKLSLEELKEVAENMLEEKEGLGAKVN